MYKRFVEFSSPINLGFSDGLDPVWEINWKIDQIETVWKFFGREVLPNSLYEVVELFGVNCILSIGGLSGTLIEPEVMQDLKYPGGQPKEESWQYLWRPTELSRQLINTEINAFKRCPEKLLAAMSTVIFKSLIPLKITNYGQFSTEVCLIPLKDLPDLTKTDLIWRLEKSEL